MEKRLGTALVLIYERSQAPEVNLILSKYSSIILGRMGIPMQNRQEAIISLVLEGTTDEIGALTGQLGRLPGVQVKSVLTK